jgi:hypothetical protein
VRVLRGHAVTKEDMRRTTTLGEWAAALAMLAALALGIGPAHGASVRRAGPVIGIGEQKPTMFASRYWRRLAIRDARYTAPWDALNDPYQRQLLDTWMTAARNAHLRVMLGFAHSLRSERLAHKLPSVRQFERQFRRFRARYPWVNAWLVWNEANNPGALTARRPRRAAQYFNVVARHCRHCRIIAADLLDTSNMAAWVTRFQRHAQSRPRIWGLHNYGDTNGFKTRSTQRLLALTTGQIWFTETGGVVLRRIYRGRSVLRTYRYSLQHAAKATTHALRLACLSHRITRIYLYHWQAPAPVTTWDSGLLNARGRPRPAYFALQTWLSRAATAALDGGRSALCSTAD